MIVALIALPLLGYAALLVMYYVPERPVSQLRARWALPPSQFVMIGGMSVHLRDEGPRDDASPIVLLHGTSASLHTWDGWTAALIPHKRVIRFDMRGFGLTGPAPDGRYDIESYVQTVMAVLKQLGVQRCILAGNSHGGYVAWATALLHREAVDRLILVDSGGYTYQPKSVPLGFRLARTPLIGTLFAPILPRRVVEDSLRNVYGTPDKVTPELVDRYHELTARAGNRRALVERFKQTQPNALQERVRELRLPTLILWGRQDRLIPPEYGERFHRDIAGSQLCFFDPLGHVPHEEDPGQTVAVVKAFLGLAN